VKGRMNDNYAGSVELLSLVMDGFIPVFSDQQHTLVLNMKWELYCSNLFDPFLLMSVVLFCQIFELPSAANKIYYFVEVLQRDEGVEFNAFPECSHIFHLHLGKSLTLGK
jgi:hypothetical protein